MEAQIYKMGVERAARAILEIANGGYGVNILGQAASSETAGEISRLKVTIDRLTEKVQTFAADPSHDTEIHSCLTAVLAWCRKMFTLLSGQQALYRFVIVGKFANFINTVCLAVEGDIDQGRLTEFSANFISISATLIIIEQNMLSTLVK